MVTTAPPASSFNGGVNTTDDDDDNDNIVHESLRDGLTTQSFTSLIDNATISTDLLKNHQSSSQLFSAVWAFINHECPY
jgi:hypothetical protein